MIEMKNYCCDDDLEIKPQRGNLSFFSTLLVKMTEGGINI